MEEYGRAFATLADEFPLPTADRDRAIRIISASNRNKELKLIISLARHTRSTEDDNHVPEQQCTNAKSPQHRRNRPCKPPAFGEVFWWSGISWWSSPSLTLKADTVPIAEWPQWKQKDDVYHYIE